MLCVVCDCSDSLMLTQLNTSKLKRITPSLNVCILTDVMVGLYRTPTPTKRLITFCNVSENAINILQLHLLQFGKTQRFANMGYELHQNAFRGRALPGPAGGAKVLLQSPNP